MRETEKTIELMGRKWRFHKLNPLEGSNLLRKFVRGEGVNPDTFLSNLSDEDFISIQRSLLSTVYEIKTTPEGAEATIPVFNGGMLAVIFNSADEAFVVTAVALAFNLQGFFEGNALTEFGQIVKSFNA
jgi:hypothetical protein